MSENKEIELKEVFSTISELKKELHSNLFKIFLLVISFTVLSLVFSLAQDSRYKAELSFVVEDTHCLLYTSPSPRDGLLSRMPSSA